jgi:7-cyano-7-deazaguanine synthase
MSKKIALLFSGGLDSTYLLWKNLKEGNTVTPIYVEIKNNEKKTILEKNRIELLHKEFKKEFDPDAYWEGNSKLKHLHYLFNVGVSANEDSLYFKQVPIWTAATLFMQSLDVDEIQIGYVSNDDAIPYLDDIRKIYKSYQAICKPMKPLKFPLTKFKKELMARELPEKYLNLVVSCENPQIISSKDVELVEYLPCCRCEPCKRIINGDYYGLGHFPKNYDINMIQDKIFYLHNKGYKIQNPDGTDYFEGLRVEAKKEPYQLKIDFDNENYAVDYDG